MSGQPVQVLFDSMNVSPSYARVKDIPGGFILTVDVELHSWQAPDVSSAYDGNGDLSSIKMSALGTF